MRFVLSLWGLLWLFEYLISLRVCPNSSNQWFHRVMSSSGILVFVNMFQLFEHHVFMMSFCLHSYFIVSLFQLYKHYACVVRLVPFLQTLWFHCKLAPTLRTLCLRCEACSIPSNTLVLMWACSYSAKTVDSFCRLFQLCALDLIEQMQFICLS